MTSYFANWDEPTLDLAIDRFTLGLDQQGDANLNRLASRADLDEFEDTLAAVQLACLGNLESPSVDFLNRLESAGREQVGASNSPEETDSDAQRPAPVLAFAGWLAAAALLVSFIITRTGGEPSPVDGRAALVADAGDLINIDWTATSDPAATGVGGDVVWSKSMQQGYMRFQGLTPNDPKVAQYQLWIFDPTRADWEAKPVDGGVFDVSGQGNVVVPIDAKLAINETALFAVTIEVPGGVVVSEREHLILTAAL
ncbi:MAG: hypothetical protein ACI8QZ_001243 [Chlamydiales bacterium]|jgi:hypothetical protein